MDVLLSNSHWMTWNVFLALVPLALAGLLFSKSHRPGIFWIIGVSAFVVFLPNAAYVVTDLVHIPGQLHALQGRTAATFGLLVEYGLLLTIGVGAYVGSLELVRRDLERRRFPQWVRILIEIVLYVGTAVGVLLGRFARFNSWDLWQRPDTVLDHAVSRIDRPASWMMLFLMFLVTAICTLGARALTKGVGYEWQRFHSRWN